MATPKPQPGQGYKDNVRDQTAPGGRHQATGYAVGRPEQLDGKHQAGGNK